MKNKSSKANRRKKLMSLSALAILVLILVFAIVAHYIGFWNDNKQSNELNNTVNILQLPEESQYVFTKAGKNKFDIKLFGS